MSGRISSPTLIGRDSELAELWGAWERASSGTPAVLLVGGEAGVGKTRLVNEFSSQIRDALVLQGACVELGRMMLPFAPLVTILRQLSRIFGPEKARDLYGAELGRFVGAGDAAGGTEAVGTVMPEQFDALIAVRSLFGRLAAQSPVVVVLEDLHWAGRSTLDLLSFLARNLDDLPLLIVGTYRSDELRRTHPLRPVLAELGRLDHVDRIDLAPLDETELIRLVTAIRGTQPELAVLSTILDRAEGNPFFAEELLASTPAGTTGIPATLTDIIGVRLERLGAEAAEVVRIAAAAGRRMDHRLLEEVFSMRSPDLETGLRDAVQQDVLVVEGDGYRFRHALVQEVAHSQLLPGERARLHAAFADALARDPELAAGGAAGVHAELAHHALEAHELDLAFTSLVLAARHEQQLSAHAEAERHLAVAIGLYDQLSDEAAAQAPPLTELLSGAAASARYGGDPRAGVAYMQRAIKCAETSDDPLLTGELYTELSESLWISASGDEALAASDRSIEILPPQPTRERAGALGWHARLLMLQGRSREAVAPGQEAVAIARRLDIPLELSRALNALGTSLSILGFGEGRRMLGESIEIASRIGAGVDLVRGYINICSTLNSPYDDLAGVEQVALEGLAAAERIGALVPAYDWLRLELVDALIRQGRWEEAEDHIGRVRSASASGVFGERYQSTVGALRIRQGRLDEAERHLLIAEASTPWIRDPQAVVSQLDVRLRLLLARGEPEQAAAVVPEGLLVSDDPTVVSLFPVLARCAAEAGMAGDPGARTRGEALEGLLIERMGWTELGQAPYESTKRWSRLVRAELSRLDGSDPGVWQTALAAMRRSVEVDFELEAQLRLAEAWATVGDTDAARSELWAAYDRASAIGAAGQVAELEDCARRHRIRLPGSGAAGLDPALGLTTRELEVLRLVAEGRTNREIGARLYISQKTASVHVSNILAKLDVTNRSEAGAKARQLGLDGTS